jgi:hypothetical protein
MPSHAALVFAPALALALAGGVGAFAVGAAKLGVTQAQPQVWVISPQDGATVQGSTVVLQIGTENLKVTDQGTTPDTPNEGHFHTTLDNRPFIAHYSRTVAFNNLEPGDHAIRVEPVINGHMQTLPGVQPIIVRFRTTGTTSGPQIWILSPQEAEEIYGSTVTLRLDWTNLNVVEPGVNALRDNSGEGHFHTTLDGRPFVAHYNGTQPFSGLNPGEHTIVVEPVLSSHMVPIPGTQPLRVTFRTE